VKLGPPILPRDAMETRPARVTGSSPNAEFQQKSFGSEIIIGIVFAAPIPRRGYRRDEQSPACGCSPPQRVAQAKTSTKVKPNGK
jgi:hypothetical protein